MTQRRKFLATCGACVVAGLAPGALVAAMQSGGDVHSDAKKGLREQFRGLLGGRFRFLDTRSGVSASAHLAEVRSGPEQPRLEQFSLLFSVDSGVALTEGIYRVTAPAGQTLDLFVTPGTQRAGAQLLRAEFSLIV